MLNLNSDIVIYILSEWLDFTCLGKLDVATGGYAERMELLRLLKSKECVILRTKLVITIETGSMLAWLQLRRISVSKIKFAMSSKPAEMGEFLQSQSHCVSSLTLDEIHHKAKDNLHLILPFCFSLTKLSIDFWNANFKAVLNGLKLTCLKISFANLTAENIIEIGRSCCFLRDFSINECSLSGVAEFPMNTEYFRQLQYLKIIDLSLTMEAIEFIIKNAKKLTSFECDEDISSVLVSHGVSLTSLVMPCYHFESGNMKILLERSSDLTVLKTKSLSNECILALGQHCLQINTLFMTINDISVLENVALLLSKLKLLTSTEVIAHSYNCNSIVQSLANSGCDLKRFSIHCEFLNESVQFVTAFPNLLVCELCGSGPADTIVFLLAKHCLKLSELSLTGYWVTDTSLIALVKSCLNLTSLHLASSPSLTDKCVLQIVANSSDLEYLGVCADSFTKLSLYTLCAGLPHLNTLNLYVAVELKHPQGMDKGVEFLRKERPKVEMNVDALEVTVSDEDSFVSYDDSDF